MNGSLLSKVESSSSGIETSSIVVVVVAVAGRTVVRVETVVAVPEPPHPPMAMTTPSTSPAR